MTTANNFLFNYTPNDVNIMTYFQFLVTSVQKSEILADIFFVRDTILWMKYARRNYLQVKM